MKNEKKIAWLPEFDSETKILHVWTSEHGWIPYYSHVSKVMDYAVFEGGSRGYATMHHLLREGYKLVSTDEVVKPGHYKANWCQRVRTAIRFLFAKNLPI